MMSQVAKEQKSAEKDLLKIIEGKEGSSADASSLKPSGDAAVSSLSVTSSGATKKKKIGLDIKGIVSDSANINRLLMAVLVFAIGYFIMSLITEFSRLKKADEIVPTQEIMIEETPQEDSLTGDTISIEEEMHHDPEPLARNLFKPGPPKPKVDELEVVQSIPVNSVRLVGISYEENAAESYAMIENKKSNITLFLKIGEEVESMEITEILEDRVILTYEGEEVELR